MIALINDVFQHQHRAHFTAEEYLRIVGPAALEEGEESRFSTLVDEISITLPLAGNYALSAVQRAEAAANLLSSEAIFLTEGAAAKTVFPGGYMRVPDAGTPVITISP